MKFWWSRKKPTKKLREPKPFVRGPGLITDKINTAGVPFYDKDQGIFADKLPVQRSEERTSGPDERRTAVQCAVNCDRAAAQAMEKLTHARTHVGAGNLSIASELIHDALGVLTSYHDGHYHPLRRSLKLMDERDYKPAYSPLPSKVVEEEAIPDQDYLKSQVTVSVGARGEPTFSFSAEKKEKKIELSAKVVKRLAKCLRKPKVGVKELRKILASVISETPKFW